MGIEAIRQVFQRKTKERERDNGPTLAQKEAYLKLYINLELCDTKAKEDLYELITFSEELN